MTHFNVLVIGEDPERQLRPFQENNMGDCPHEYLEFNDFEDEYRFKYENGESHFIEMPDGRFLSPYDDEFRVENTGKEKNNIQNIGITFEVPIHLPSVKIRFKKAYATFDDYMRFHVGANKDLDKQRYGRWENPNAKWDYYRLGGKWKGFFTLKTGKYGVLGKKAWDSKKNDPFSEKSDSALYKDIIFTERDYITYAVLKDGDWFSKNEMDDFKGTTNEKNVLWEAKFTGLISGLRGDTRLSVFDCHI